MDTLALSTSETTTPSPPPPPTEAQLAWARCKPWIERAMAKAMPGGETIEDVQANVEAGHAVFWAGADSALITKFETLRGGKALVVVYADGDGDKLEMSRLWLPQLEDFARYFTCKFITVECQEDEFPLMEALGLRKAFTTWIKEIPEAPAAEAAAPASQPTTSPTYGERGQYGRRSHGTNGEERSN